MAGGESLVPAGPTARRSRNSASAASLTALEDPNQATRRDRRRNAAGPGTRTAPVAVWRELALRRVRLFRRPLDRAGFARRDGAGYRELGVPVHVSRGRRADLGRCRRAGYRRAARRPAGNARAGPRDGPQPRLRGTTGRVVRIRRADEPQADALAELPVTLAEGEQAYELVIDADRAKGALVAEVPVLANEAIAANNVVPSQITPRDAKLRVIYMEGSPASEISVSSRMPCKKTRTSNASRCTWTTSTSAGPGSTGSTTRRGFPTTREELLSYDVVICSDIARAAFTPEQLAWTVELVSKRGGGFAMIGGHTSFGSGGWDQTVWDGLIPVDMSGPRRRPIGILRRLVPGRSPAGGRRPPDLEDRRRPGRAIARSSTRMPMFHGTNLIDRLKPAATALGLSEQPLPGSGVVTVFSCQTFGRGRTFAMATDTTVAWGSDFEKSWGEGDNRYFRKFWRNVVRWLTENRRRRQPPAAGRDRQDHLPARRVDPDHGQGVRRGTRGNRSLPRRRRPPPAAEPGARTLRRSRQRTSSRSSRTGPIRARLPSHRRARSSTTRHDHPQADARRRRLRRRYRGRHHEPRAAGHRRPGRVPRPAARLRGTRRAGTVRPAAR